MIPIQDWDWSGHPGHFVAWRKCDFRLCTIVGEVVISTLGELRLDPESGVEPMTSDPDALYESSVFGHDGMKACGCCVDTIVEDHRETRHYQDGDKATEGHMELCWKWAEKQEDAE